MARQQKCFGARCAGEMPACPPCCRWCAQHHPVTGRSSALSSRVDIFFLDQQAQGNGMPRRHAPPPGEFDSMAESWVCPRVLSPAHVAWCSM